jgi:hypothetical protein
MNKFRLYSDKSQQITFESHLEGLEVETKTLLLNLRDFVQRLGNNVIEEVRPHRVVYAKSLTFRIFLDIQPKKGYILISIRKSRNEPVTNHTVRVVGEIENIKPQISEAYKNIK